eukprot:3167359-Prymnesium_polylepis.2
MGLNCGSRVAPVACDQTERRDRGIRAAIDAFDGTAGRAFGRLRIGVRSVIVLGTNGTFSGAEHRILADSALSAFGSARSRLIEAIGTLERLCKCWWTVVASRAVQQWHTNGV